MDVCVLVMLYFCECVIVGECLLNTVVYTCYLKGGNEQTTSALITEERERQEWAENEGDEEEKGKERCLCSSGPLWCPLKVQYVKWR